jgi:hypothetical protein
LGRLYTTYCTIYEKVKIRQGRKKDGGERGGAIERKDADEGKKEKRKWTKCRKSKRECIYRRERSKTRCNRKIERKGRNVVRTGRRVESSG